MAPPHNNKKKKGKYGVRLNKILVQKKTPSPIAQNKGKTETNMVSLVKEHPMAPKKSKKK